MKKFNNKEKAQEFIDGFKGFEGIYGNPFSEQLELNLVAGIARLLQENSKGLVTCNHNSHTLLNMRNGDHMEVCNNCGMSRSTWVPNRKQWKHRDLKE